MLSVCTEFRQELLQKLASIKVKTEVKTGGWAVGPKPEAPPSAACTYQLLYNGNNVHRRRLYPFAVWSTKINTAHWERPVLGIRKMALVLHAEEGILELSNNDPTPALAMADAAAFRSQLHRRALSVLVGLQENLDGFLRALGGPGGNAAAGGPIIQEPSSVASSSQFPASALWVPQPEPPPTLGEEEQALVAASQQRSGLIHHTYTSIDELQLDVEKMLTDLLEAANALPLGPIPGQAEDESEDAVTAGIQGDIMREAAATGAAAQRLQQRAVEASQAAAALQQAAWCKVRGGIHGWVGGAA